MQLQSTTTGQIEKIEQNLQREDFLNISVNDRTYPAHAYLFEEDSWTLKGKNVALKIDIQGNLIAILSLEEGEEGKKLYEYSYEKEMEYQSQILINMMDTQGVADGHNAMSERARIVEQCGNSLEYQEMDRQIPMFLKKELGMYIAPIKENDIFELPNYTFEQIDDIVRGDAIMEAYQEEHLRDLAVLHTSPVLEKSYERYLEVGKYLPFSRRQEKRRDYGSFVERVKYVSG